MCSPKNRLLATVVSIMALAPLQQTSAFVTSTPNSKSWTNAARPGAGLFRSTRKRPYLSMLVDSSINVPRLTLTSPLVSYALSSYDRLPSGPSGIGLGDARAALMDVAFSSSIPADALLRGNDVSSLSLDSPLISAAASSPSLPSVLSHDPSMVASELLSDAAHIALDLTTLYGPATITVRLAAVVGRILSIAADYLPDHAMLPEEFVFQMGMLAAALVSLYNAALPLAKASFATNITHRDGRVFQELFEPAGVTWAQYKALSVTAFEWVTFQPGETITSEENNDSEDFVYWLYSGEVAVESQGKHLHMVSKRPADPETQNSTAADFLGMFGEMRFFHEIECYGDECYLPHSTVKAGAAGATLLRMHAPKLTKMMKHDNHLEKSIRRIFFKGVQRKMKALLEA